MERYSILDYMGTYLRGKTPNTFTRCDGTNLILKTRKAPKISQTKYYLVVSGNGYKPSFFSSLWENSENLYSISDTQKLRGYVTFTDDTLTVESHHSKCWH
jgi:hypothetical protein